MGERVWVRAAAAPGEDARATQARECMCVSSRTQAASRGDIRTCTQGSLYFILYTLSARVHKDLSLAQRAAELLEEVDRDARESFAGHARVRHK